ncbi:sulfotransferase family protein [Amycolatopsis alba]|uniref:Sulfotransferase family protein n=1 Tax=Amycolatopsis alba DSM 44262 TaxID=1125972 RepID=A0A229R7H2_AMYAL|nr:sulfotransferase family protein [Amycolatopsis alba]OXM42620.1 sulfotransferase family protein [Amycolatopsis alba DSM 44262]
MNERPRVIALWAAPRSRSTAFFRSMIQLGGLVTLHEPFCNIVDYGRTEVLGDEITSHRELISRIREISATRTVFFKDTTDMRYDEVLADEEFLAGGQHTFLIRSPAEVAASFYAVKPDMVCSDLGLERLYELHQAVLAAGGRAPVVLDAADLVSAPEAMLRGYCERAGLPFRAEATNWAPGSRPEWELSGRWHTAVSESSGFVDKTTVYADTVENNAELKAFSDHHEPFYHLLRDTRLVPAA